MDEVCECEHPKAGHWYCLDMFDGETVGLCTEPGCQCSQYREKAES